MSRLGDGLGATKRDKDTKLENDKYQVLVHSWDGTCHALCKYAFAHSSTVASASHF